ncbi:hypothetical protein OROMI_003143 [Orobanche minor]
MISHIKRLHLCTNERKAVLREAISTDHDLFMAVEDTLKTFRQWLCGKCMSIHAMSRACHHHEGLVRVTDEVGDLEGCIVGILKPSNKECDINVNVGLTLDVQRLDQVFKMPITTVKSIPPSCRVAFSQALKTALYKVVAQPGSVDAWIRLLLLPQCTLQVFRPSNRQENRSENRWSLQQRLIMDSLATWGREDGIISLIQNMVDTPFRVVKEEKKGNDNIKQCLRKVADGHFTAAVKLLCSFGVAPYNGATTEALEAKHPYMPPPSLPDTTSSEPLVADIDAVLHCIKSFPKGTSCGRDGLRAQHILDALCGEGSAVATDLLHAITKVVNLWLGGMCPSSLSEFVASAPLTPLLKPDNGIRPIAVGTLWRRLVSNIAMKGVGKEMAKYLNYFQFGVGVSGGAEAILHEIIPKNVHFS